MRSPEAFRRDLVEIQYPGAYPLEIQIKPFGVACLDFTRAEGL